MDNQTAINTLYNLINGLKNSNNVLVNDDNYSDYKENMEILNRAFKALEEIEDIASNSDNYVVGE